jgi:hypothetical protein
LIGILHLNREDRVRWRRVHFEILDEALKKIRHAKAMRRLRDLFGFPEDMPTCDKREGAVAPYAGRGDRPDWF